MSLLLILATLQLAYEVVKAIFTSSGFLIDLDGLLKLFGVFLLVLIGIELLDTIKVYFKKHVIHVEVVLLVAIIAIARKVIVMEFEYYSGLEVIGIAAIILALSGGYYLIKNAGGCGFGSEEGFEESKNDTVNATDADILSQKVADNNKAKGKCKEEKIMNPFRAQQNAQSTRIRGRRPEQGADPQG